MGSIWNRTKKAGYPASAPKISNVCRKPPCPSKKPPCATPNFLHRKVAHSSRLLQPRKTPVSLPVTHAVNTVIEVKQRAAQEGRRFHKAVEHYINHQVPLSKRDYDRLEPLLKYMRKRGFVPLKAEVYLTDEEHALEGWADIIFRRDLEVRPDSRVAKEIPGFEVVVELKTRHEWLFPVGGLTKDHPDYKAIHSTFLFNVRQVSCYTRMRDKWNTTGLGVTGCLAYVDAKRIFLVPKDDEEAYIALGIQNLKFS